jgi:hypothetical protein
MAGVVTDLGLRKCYILLEVTAPADLYGMIFHCEDLRPDIRKACLLSCLT